MRKMIFLALFACLLVAAPFADADPIRIGVVFAKSGPAKNPGQEFFAAIDSMVKDINVAGGVLGRPIEIVEYDNQSTPIGSKKAAQEVVKQDVVAVIGGCWSSNTKILAEILQKEGIPLITPLATQPEVTEIGDYVFRVCYTDPFQGKVMAKFAWDDLSAKTAALFINVDSSYSQSIAKEFAESFETMGGTVVGSYDYLRSETDFSVIVSKVVQAHPDVVYLSGYSRDSTMIILQFHNMGEQMQFLGGDGWNSETMYGYGNQELDGNYYTNHWHKENPNPISESLQKRYADESFKGARLMLAHDALMVLVDAIERAGSVDRSVLKTTLRATSGFQGATGMISFNAKGDPVKPAVILRLENGSSRFVKAVMP